VPTESPKILLTRHGTVDWTRLEEDLEELEVRCQRGDGSQVRQVLERIVLTAEAGLDSRQKLGSKVVAIN
jgi:hypothetical protein